MWYLSPEQLKGPHHVIALLPLQQGEHIDFKSVSICATETVTLACVHGWLSSQEYSPAVPDGCVVSFRESCNLHLYHYITSLANASSHKLQKVIKDTKVLIIPMSHGQCASFDLTTHSCFHSLCILLPTAYVLLCETPGFPSPGHALNYEPSAP